MLENGDEAARVRTQFAEAEAFKRPFAKDWARWYLLYSGRHWDGRQPEWMSTPVVNLTFSVIQTILPIMTDSRPQISVIPRAPEHEGSANIMRGVVEWLWEHLDLDVMLPKVMLNALVFGNGFMKVMWDAEARNGLGDIRVVPVDPSHIFVSPYARTIEDADYVIHAENIPYGLVKRMYPQFAAPPSGPAEPKLTLDRSVTNQGTGSGSEHQIRSTDGSMVTIGTPGGDTGGSGTDDKVVTVYERWERKDGQIFQTVVANDEVLLHQRSPFSHQRFPFVHFVDYPNAWGFWASGEVQQVERLQIEINRRRGHILDILRYTANPILIVDPASGIEYSSLVARPGLVVPAEGGPSAVSWLQPPAIPNALFQVNELDKRDFDIVLGQVDVLQGRRPEGIEAGIAIEMLQEAANVRMRLKVRFMEAALRRLGELLVGMVQQFYRTERVFSIVGSEIQNMGKSVGFMSINSPQSAKIGPDGEPQVTYANQIPPMDVEFDIRIGPGSTLPVSRSQQFQKVVMLYQMRLVDDTEVLKYSGLPRWDEVTQRARQYWGVMAAMEQQAQAQQEASAMPGEESMAMSDDQITEDAMAQGGNVPLLE